MAIAILSAVGVYIGRYARWNSWDGLTQPWNVAADFWRALSSSTTSGRVLTVLLTVLLLEAISFGCVDYLQRHYKKI